MWKLEKYDLHIDYIAPGAMYIDVENVWSVSTGGFNAPVLIVVVMKDDILLSAFLAHGHQSHF